MQKNHVRALGVLSAVLLPALVVHGVENASWGDLKTRFGSDAGPMAAAKGKASKVDVCHYDADAGTFHLINVSGNALPAHLAHGDGQPGDGQFDGQCGPVAATFTASVGGGFGNEASGQTVTLSCDTGTISVVSGLYGQNCIGGGYSGSNNPDVTAHLVATCDGQSTCNYLVDHTVIGDPFFLCYKQYTATWTCQ